MNLDLIYKLINGNHFFLHAFTLDPSLHATAYLKVMLDQIV